MSFELTRKKKKTETIAAELFESGLVFACIENRLISGSLLDSVHPSWLINRPILAWPTTVDKSLTPQSHRPIPNLVLLAHC